MLRIYDRLMALSVLLTLVTGFVMPCHGATKTQKQTIPDHKPTYASRSASLSDLPPDLREIAGYIDALQVMQELDTLQKQLRNAGSSSSSIEYLAKRQKLIYLHQKLMHRLDTANLEVNATRGQIEVEMARMQELRARIVDENARQLRRNTIINFVSGGITKMVGYSIALGPTDTPANILEVADGGVQCALSALTMKQLQSESESVKELPELLAVLEQPEDRAHIYPDSVWMYLSDSAGQTARKQVLCDTWRGRGVVARRDKATTLRSSSSIRHPFSLAKMAPQLLDDRMAMLFELRSLVSQMHQSLMQLSEVSKRSFDNDPSFDWPA